MRHNFLILLLALLAAGCTPQKFIVPTPLAHPATLFPADAFITQRGVLTVRGRQFTLNGYVAKSKTRGLRLIMTENFGGVLADVLVKPDGNVFVLKAAPPFRPAWVKKYIAADLQCVFVDRAGTNCPLQMLSQTHFVIERRGYKLDLRTVEVKPGVQPAEMFDEKSGGKP
ncbi:MAG TPA: hypothetical protein VIK62_00625 [Verrucomicrobiae bacterium]